MTIVRTDTLAISYGFYHTGKNILFFLISRIQEEEGC